MPVATERDKRQQARAGARKARDLAQQLERAAGITSDAERMRKRRAADRDVRIQTLSDADRAERIRREQDDELWLRSYWSAFSVDDYYTLSSQQRQMVADFNAALAQGGDRATAASRGEGKTSLCLAMLCKRILQGSVKFGVVFGANAEKASEMVARIQAAFVRCEELAHYYPEVCAPIIALENAPSRAKKQTVSGDRYDNGEPYEMAQSCFHWTGDRLIFPDVPGSPAAGAIVVCAGLKAASRGANILNRRPDVVIIDDPDTIETQTNGDQATKLLTIIDGAMAPMGSQKRPVARIALMTIGSHCSAAAQLTDRKKYPSWRGRRYRFMIKPPTDQNKWNEFISLCKQGWEEDKAEDSAPIPWAAHQFFLANREAMEAGGEISNPERYNHQPRPEGGTVEASAFEFYYGQVARTSAEKVATEYDNEPPVEEAGILTRLTVYHVRAKARSFAPGPAGEDIPLERYVCPPNTAFVTRGGDLSDRGIYWVSVAWTDRAVGSIVDFDFEKFPGTEGIPASACEKLVLSGLQSWWERQASEGYEILGSQDDQRFAPDLTFVDCGWKDKDWGTQPVYILCHELGYRGVYPCKGIPNWRDRPAMPGKIWNVPGGDVAFVNVGDAVLAELNADVWKLRVHHGLLQEFGSDGSLGLYVPPRDERGYEQWSRHQDFAHHILAEEWQLQPSGAYKWVPTGVRPGSRRVQVKRNHWLDALAYAVAARAALGVRTIAPAPTPEQPQQSPHSETIESSAVGASGGDYGRSRW